MPDPHPLRTLALALALGAALLAASAWMLYLLYLGEWRGARGFVIRYDDMPLILEVLARAVNVILGVVLLALAVLIPWRILRDARRAPPHPDVDPPRTRTGRLRRPR